MIERDEDRLTPEAESALEILRSVEAPRANPGFRERLRAEFAWGRIVETESAPGRAREAEDRRPKRTWFSRPLVRIAAVCAAAALVVTAGIILNRGPAWNVAGASGTGVVRVDDRTIPIERMDLLGDGIRPGAEVGMPETGKLVVASAGTLRMELTPGVRLTIPKPPSRWLWREADLYTQAGTIRLTTGPEFPGSRLRIHTPDAVVHVTGTTLAVILEPGGTCVCVLEGEVRVAPRGGEMMSVPAGKRRYFFRDGSPTDSIRDRELSELARLRSTGLFR